MRRRENTLPYWDLNWDPSLAQPITSRYSDCAILGSTHNSDYLIILVYKKNFQSYYFRWLIHLAAFMWEQGTTNRARKARTQGKQSPEQCKRNCFSHLLDVWCRLFAQHGNCRLDRNEYKRTRDCAAWVHLLQKHMSDNTEYDRFRRIRREDELNSF